jgi:hypothetical protein
LNRSNIIVGKDIERFDREEISLVCSWFVPKDVCIELCASVDQRPVCWCPSSTLGKRLVAVGRVPTVGEYFRQRTVCGLVVYVFTWLVEDVFDERLVNSIE